jgi:hypothetical protein
MTHRLELFDQQDEVTPGQIADLWQRETGMPEEEVARRLHEVLFVVLDDGELIGISSAFLSRNDRLRMDLWHYRVFVLGSHRRGHLAIELMNRGREHYEELFTSGRDRRGAGVIAEAEGPELQAANYAVWRRTLMAFIGVNERGWPVRVRYFPGALAPEP